MVSLSKILKALSLPKSVKKENTGKGIFYDIIERGQAVEEKNYENMPYNIRMLQGLGKIEVFHLQGTGYAVRIDENRGYYGCFYNDDGAHMGFVSLTRDNNFELRNE